MKPAPAKDVDGAAFEEVGRATLQIVHDLKNQLNGLKLYATYLRKRLERDDQAVEERETLMKLIAGLDRAAKEMTALVRYAKPIELRFQPHADLKSIVHAVVDDAATRGTGGLPAALIKIDVSGDDFRGEFDPAALTEALKAVTDDLRATISAKDTEGLLVRMRRDNTDSTPRAVIEWHGGKPNTRNKTFASNSGCGTIHSALAARIIEGHGGSLSCEGNLIRAWLPLSRLS